ncbi:MAG: phenylalanine--tRNA ligase subunit alpha [bacterium]|nr:phenylalanine--tRNA ligase subunit alpha [bacterium]
MPKKQSPDIFQTLRKDAFGALEEASDFEAVGKAEAEYLGKAGRLTNILKSLKDLAEQERKEIGSTANALKKEIEEKIRIKKNEFVKTSRHPESGRIDISIPGKKILRGHFHPLSRLMQEVIGIFESMGFEVAEGPEVETEYYNFDALNVPKDHPARDMWNTFWLQGGGKNKNLLRTHTSPMEIRYMESHQPPLRVVVPGRCFRYEATDATHDVQFYQLEGLMIGEKINLAHLKGIVEVFFKKLFKGKDIEVRFRPSYFPFVEPGVEVDVRLAQKGEWLEIAGAGMTHPQVIRNVGLNSNEWQGFAFGMGLDRIAMIKYKIDDIRLFYSGDLRFIKQF